MVISCHLTAFCLNGLNYTNPGPTIRILSKHLMAKTKVQDGVLYVPILYISPLCVAYLVLTMQRASP